MQQAQKGATILSRGGTQANAAAVLLSQAATQLADAGTQLSEGMKSHGAAMRQAQARSPSEAELRALRSGATSLSNGQASLADALTQMQGGADRLTAVSPKSRRVAKIRFSSTMTSFAA